MSETLRELVVSLSLDSDNFSRNIRTINQQIKEAESAFKLAGAGVNDFEKSSQGAQAKVTLLKEKLTQQQRAVDQYSRALEAANKKLSDSYTRQGKLEEKLRTAKTTMDRTKSSVDSAKATYKGLADTLGETDSATTAAKQNLEQAEQEYADASAEVKKLEGQLKSNTKTLQNNADAVSKAQTNLNDAQSAVRNTQSALEKSNKALQLAQTNWESAGEAIENSRTAFAAIGADIKNAQSRYNLATAGLDRYSKKHVEAAAKVELLNDQVRYQGYRVQECQKAFDAAVERLEAAEKTGDPDKTRQATAEVVDAQTALTNARAELKNLEMELKTASSAWTAFGKAMTSAGTKLEKAGKTLTSVGKTLTASLTTPIVALGTTAVKASIDFEDSFTSVRKTVDATEEEFDALAAASKKMSTEVAASTDDINEVMATGGQLGISAEYLADFTRVMIDLGNSCEDLSATDAATTLAKFANIMGTSQSQFSNIGSTLVDLGNNFATTEAEIMELAMRLSGAGKQVGLTEAQVMGFAAALSSVGINAEAGGTAFSKALTKMEVAAATGGQELEDFAKVSGMTAKEFKSLWDSDPAAAFQAFIEGLAKLDESGESAIAVLEEIGISEVRLRDTLLRSVNATDLFTRAQDTANKAWEENTALTEEANKRYATTKSRLTNLKNTAVLFAQRIGDDLNPTINSLIDGAAGLLEKFMSLDESQRMQIIQFAAIAAAAGPVISIVGKLTSGIGSAFTAIGEFATAVGEAGGGLKGFATVLGSSPAAVIAITAAVAAGTVALIDYASGAKQAREALKGMEETAQSWKNTAAETFYGTSKGLSFFGMSSSDFAKEEQSAIQSAEQSAQDWYSGMIKVWLDGKEETNAIVSEWTDSFKEITAAHRANLQQLKSKADASGNTALSEQLQEELDKLDAYDERVAYILRNRQNEYIWKSEREELKAMMADLDGLEVKFTLTEDSADIEGFDLIEKKLEAVVARAKAIGKEDADVSVYENAVVTAAQGMALVNEQLDAQYDTQYEIIRQMTDEEEKQKALALLNEQYNADRKAAAQAYAETLANIVMPVWEQEDIQGAKKQLADLVTLMAQYSNAADGKEQAGILEQMNELTAGMDEGALTEYISLLTQIQSLMDSGMSEEEVQSMFPDIDFSDALVQIASIQEFLKNRTNLLPGLASMFGETLPEEVLKIATDLDMTGAQERWNEFAQNPGAITTQAIIAGYDLSDRAKAQQLKVDAFIQKYTEVPEGADTDTPSIAMLTAYVKTFAEYNGKADVSELKPEVAAALVKAYEELNGKADVSALTPDKITARVKQYMEANGVNTDELNPSDITAYILAYKEIRNRKVSVPTPQVAAMIVSYMNKEGIDLSKLSDEQAEAVVGVVANILGLDYNELLVDVTALLEGYRKSKTFMDYIPMKIAITGYDMKAYTNFLKNNPVTVQGIVRLGDTEYGDDPEAALSGENVKFYGLDGIEIPATAVAKNQLDASSFCVYEEDGTLHVFITPKITGAEEAVAAAADALSSTKHQGSLGAKLFGLDTRDDIRMLTEALQRSYNDMNSFLNFGGWMNGYARWAASTNLANYLDAAEIANIQVLVAETIANVNKALADGGTPTIPEDTIADLQAIQNMIELLDAIGIGENVTAGISEGLAEAGFDVPAEDVASALESALNSALGIHSPSTRMVPVGEDTAAGVGQGLSGYSFAAEADAMASNLFAAASAALSGAKLSPVGLQAMNGLKAGINAGRSAVANAMRSAARAAVNAAKSALKIHSPSRVFKDEVGAMTMKGFGEGVISESKKQAATIRNAAKYLTGEAKNGSVAPVSNDNRRTYNNDNSTTLSFAGASFNVRSNQDIHDLAVEIAALTRRNQRGKGLRMA